MGIATALVILLVAAPAVHAVDHIVGDSSGWSTLGDYATWASGKTFNAGDSLVFNYDGSHKVDVVSKDGYENCDSSNVLESHQGGSTTIKLKDAGPMYFICPSLGHCSGGMKLAITVAAIVTNTPPASSSGGTTTPSTKS
ncbi:uclacyanin-3-like [Carica papaya]|uniref:uclacyanin-3-like n=1 Tax=Carica papaya TaxID=3649 RepID=UPI000B8C762F|nr:uclacyanin-3-like [Carica papaya]